MSVKVPENMPCKRDCPDRKPGCFCERKKAWDLQQEEKKQMILEAKKKASMVLGVRNPDRVKKARKK